MGEGRALGPFNRYVLCGTQTAHSHAPFCALSHKTVNDPKAGRQPAWCRLHDLRHTFISALAEAGAPESTMKAIAGWRSAKMLERYSRTRELAKREAVHKLPGRRPAGSPQNPPTVDASIEDMIWLNY